MIVRSSASTGGECRSCPCPCPAPRAGPGPALARVMQRLLSEPARNKNIKAIFTLGNDLSQGCGWGKKSPCSQNLFPTAHKELLYAETSPERKDPKHILRQSQIPTSPRFHGFPKPSSSAQRQSSSKRTGGHSCLSQIQLY